jgi:hypothetical protein
MAWLVERIRLGKGTSGGWGAHGWVYVLGKWIEDNLQMGKLMVDDMEG